jgi:nicotinate-nucleotide adenylyltransferase
MKWGLLGGTFDPIHLGHLRCAEEVREIFNLDRVMLIPTARQPLKTEQAISLFHHRYDMVERAIASNPSFSISDIEARRGGTSYSIDTVRHFLDHEKDLTELYFILGQDAFDNIRQWKGWRALLGLCHFVVMTRPGYDVRKLPDILTHEVASEFVYDTHRDGFRGPTETFIYFRYLTLLDISATDIRRRVADGRSIMYLVPDMVGHYIRDNALYRDREGTP